MADWNEVKVGMTISFKGAPASGVIVKEIEMSGDALFGGIKVVASTGEVYNLSALHAMSIYAKPAAAATITAKPAGKLVDANGQPTYGPCDDAGNPVAFDAHEDGSVWVSGRCLPQFRFEFTGAESADVLDGVLTVSETAELTGRAEITVRKAIERGTLPARKSAGTWLVRREDALTRWGDTDMRRAALKEKTGIDPMQKALLVDVLLTAEEIAVIELVLSEREEGFVAKRGIVEDRVEQRSFYTAIRALHWLAMGDPDAEFKDFVYPSPGGGGQIFHSGKCIIGVGEDGAAVNF